MDSKLPSSTLITKFNLKDKSLYMKLIWKENEHDLFQIKVFDGETSWSGRFSNQFAENYRERVDESKDQYNNNVKKSLTACDDQFTYDFLPVQGDTDTATFRWKREFPEGVQVHGAVPVHRDTSPDSKDMLIDFLLSENKDLRLTIEDCNAKTGELCANLEKCKSELEQFVNLKTSLETSLYGKFVQLLNAKKTRIQVLEDNLQKFNRAAVQQIEDGELD